MSKESNVCQVGKVRKHYAELRSTNDTALLLLRQEKPPEGLVITTDFQQAGRGQMQNNWHSDAGQNILMSTILYPTFLPLSKAFYLNKCVSLALVQVLAEVADLEAEVKWPNDIYVNSQKIAGILIQNTLQGDRLISTVVGIGLNVNQTRFNADLTRATSLSLLKSKTFDRAEVLAALSRALTQRYQEMKNNQEILDREYHRLLYRRGVWSTYLDEKQDLFQGMIEGIDPDGKLKMLIKSGESRSFAHSEIKFI